MQLGLVSLAPLFVCVFWSNIMLIIVLFIIGLIFAICYLGYRNYVARDLMRDNASDSFDNDTAKDVKLEKQTIRHELLMLLEDESVFTRKGLKITDLADMLYSNRTYISNVINDEFNMSFTDLINEYRVDYTKKILSQPEKRGLTLSEVRIMSGFSSDSSFYRIFKQKEGITPLEYKKKCY